MESLRDTLTTMTDLFNSRMNEFQMDLQQTSTPSEFLTKVRHNAFLVARERARINKCWTREGTIFVVTSEVTRHRAECMADLDEIPGPGSTKRAKSPAANVDAVPKAAGSKGTVSRSKRAIKKI
ncbi:unnamed protein product [Euphydryas editha]|uniref:Uncharacterized protein n=1 Tax=Euphydryas editha TaxID=104508 RepID=A0AAU9UAL1_EUPED|nr:unnamed protein product [Euphydryas editha]